MMSMMRLRQWGDWRTSSVHPTNDKQSNNKLNNKKGLLSSATAATVTTTATKNNGAELHSQRSNQTAAAAARHTVATVLRGCHVCTDPESDTECARLAMINTEDEVQSVSTCSTFTSVSTRHTQAQQTQLQQPPLLIPFQLTTTLATKSLRFESSVTIHHFEDQQQSTVQSAVAPLKEAPLRQRPRQPGSFRRQPSSRQRLYPLYPPTTPTATTTRSRGRRKRCSLISK